MRHEERDKKLKRAPSKNYLIPAVSERVELWRNTLLGHLFMEKTQENLDVGAIFGDEAKTTEELDLNDRETQMLKRNVWIGKIKKRKMITIAS